MYGSNVALYNYVSTSGQATSRKQSETEIFQMALGIHEIGGDWSLAQMSVVACDAHIIELGGCFLIHWTLAFIQVFACSCLTR